MSDHLDLEKEISEIEQFHEQGFDRVKTWYEAEGGQRQEETGLDDPPHELILDRAAGFVTWGLGINESIQGTMDDDPGVIELHEILLAIGAELLLKGGILKVDHEYYFLHSSAGRSMGFQKAQNKILGELRKELNSNQRLRLKRVLDLLKLKRDEAVHFGFHRRGYSGHSKEIYKVLAYLFDRFGESDLEVVEALDNLIEDRQARHTGMDYRPVEFPH